MGLRAIYPKRRTSSPGDGHKIYPYLLSMDGRGRWLDNVYVEHLWRSLKQEEVYRRAYETVAEARKGIADYLRYFNEERPHQGLDNRTPDDVFYKRKPAAQSSLTRRDSTLKSVKKTVQFFRTTSVPARCIPLNRRRLRHTARSPGRKTQKHGPFLWYTIQWNTHATARVHQRLTAAQLATIPIVRHHLAHKRMILCLYQKRCGQGTHIRYRRQRSA